MITGKKPIELFDYTNIDRDYRELLKKYHPDVGGTDEDFLYLREAYEIAKKEKEAGYAIGPSTLYFFSPNNRRIDYKSVCEFCYGKVYVGDELLIYEFPGFSLVDDLRKASMISFPFADNKLREKFNNRQAS